MGESSFQISGDNVLTGAQDDGAQINRNRDHSPCFENMPIWQAYIEDGLTISFVIAGTEFVAVCSTLASCENGQFSDVDHSGGVQDRFGTVLGEKWEADKFSKPRQVQQGRACASEYQLMLDGYVENVKAVYRLIPARIKLERRNYSLDLFAGELHLSVLHGGYKSFRASRKGELDTSFISGLSVDDHLSIPDKCERSEIKSRSQIMKGVSHNHRQYFPRGRSQKGSRQRDHVPLASTRSSVKSLRAVTNTPPILLVSMFATRRTPTR